MYYDKEQIEAALTLLNGLEIRPGIENAKRITMIDMILRQPKGDKQDGGDKKV